MLASIILYVALAILFIAIVSVLVPLKLLGIRTRAVAAVVALAACATAVATLAWPSPADEHATRTTRLDELMPVWQFDEKHSIHVAAPPERVFEAIRSVRADEIALYNALTWIRRGGRNGPESIINASGKKPLLDVATRSGFLLLADDAPRELVLGAIVVAPKGVKVRDELRPDVFRTQPRPGFGLAAMNFLVTPDGRGGSDISTETRVYANDHASLRAFTIYWRIIHPGSDIIRRMWLRAIRARAESAPA